MHRLLQSRAVLATLILGAVGVGLTFLLVAPSTERTTREVALTCDPKMAGEFHIHPFLDILVEGEKVPVPSDIGVGPTCMTVLHTHSSDGLLHVESPEKRDFTLGDFFAVWDKPFTKDQILTYTADATHRIRVTVNGAEVDTYENTVLTDGARIVVHYETIETP